MRCDICHKKVGLLEKIRGFLMHSGCAPGYWLKDRDDAQRFMVKVRAGGWWTIPGRDKR